MHIGIDITALYVAQAGVFYYHYNLVKAILQLEASPHRFTLLDYFPIHGGWRPLPEVAALASGGACLHRVKGLRHRQLARLSLMRPAPLNWLARVVDEVFLYPWGKLARGVMVRQLSRHLAGLDVFHSSDVLQYAVSGARNVTTIYDLTTILLPEHHTAQTRALQQEKFRFAQEQADAVIVISESTRRDVVEHLGLDRDKVHVVYGGVDPVFRPLPREVVEVQIAALGLEPKKYLLHLGTIEPRKNLVRLVEAYHLLRRSVAGPHPKLVLAGGKGWLYRDVFERVHALDLQDEVLFLGKVRPELVPALYNGALIFVYPSVYEGFGLPPLEAMACGVPVVTSNASSLPEVVGDAGLTVPPGDTAALTEAIVSLMHDGPRRSDLARKGRGQAQQFTWQRAALETLRVYAQPEQGGRPGPAAG